MDFDLANREQLNSAASDSLYFSDLFGDQSEVLAALQDKSSVTGVPMGVLTKADNRHLPKPYDVGGYDERLKRAIVENPDRASYFKDYMPEWDEVTKEVVNRQKMTGKLSPQALTHLTDEELAARIRALEAPDVEAAQEEIHKLETQNAVINFMDSMFNDNWRKLSDDALKTRLSVVSDATGINVEDIDFKDLRETKDVEVGKNLVNLFGAVDMYDAAKTLGAWRKYSNLDLTKVDKNSPLDQQLYKLELLRKEREMLRDETMTTKILNGAIGSVPFMLEFALTGPLAGGLHEGASFGTRQLLRTLMTGGYKEVIRRAGAKGVMRAVGQGIKEAAVSGVKRLPFYIPKITMETLGEIAPNTITLIGEDGKPTVELSEKDTVDFFQRFVTNALSQYSELASEEVGGLLNSVMPKFVQNYVVHNLVTNPMTRKIANRMIQRVSWDGLLGEFSEEEIGNFMMYGVTLLENALQLRRQNTPMVDSPILGKEESLVTLGSIALQGAMLTGASVAFSKTGERALIQNAIAARGVIENADTIVDGLKKIHSVGDNTSQMRWAIDSLNGGESGSVELAVSDAEALFQAVKNESPEMQKDLLEAFEEMGLNEQKIAEHRRKGTDIVLSDSQIFAVARNFKAGRDAMHRIFENASTAVFGKTAKDLASSDFTKEQLDKMLEDRVIRDNAMKRWQGIINESLRTAQENAIAAGNPVGLTQSAIRNYESMMPFLANYLGTNALGEEGLKRVDAMVEGISFEFIQDPEAFDPNQAMAEIIGSGTVRELENRVNELKTKLDGMQKDGNASGEEYLKTTEEYRNAQQELDDAKANPVFQTVQSLNDSISAAAKQEIGSGETSLDQVAAGFKKIDFKPGTFNLDLGGGKFDRGTEYLAEKGVTNLVYDPVNRSAESNTRIYDAVRNGGVDTVTCNNVLNVIKESGARSNVILQAAKALKPDGVAYFTVYEGDGTGNSRETSKGWQEHRKTADYVDEIKQHFGDVVRKGKIIEARNPIIEGKASAWFNEGFGAAPALFQVDDVYTGSAADFEQPSTLYIGTGEGGRIYGWGLYGSSDRTTAENYAKSLWYRKYLGDRLDVFTGVEFSIKQNGEILENKPSSSAPDAFEVSIDGITGDDVKAYALSAAWDYALDRDKPDPELIGLRMRDNYSKPTTRSMRIYAKGKAHALIRRITNARHKAVLDAISVGPDAYDKASQEYESAREELYKDVDSFIDSLDLGPSNKNLGEGQRNLYKQIFWPNKNEDLLDWQKKIPEHQREKILAQGVKERIGRRYGLTPSVSDKYYRTSLEIHLDFATNGQGIYKQLERLLGSDKAASEFLYRAGIDGVTYIGDRRYSGKKEGVRDYVAFNGADIKVIEHTHFQKTDDRIYRGVFLSDFKYSHDSLIGLFNGANASTLPHESAHWLKRCMEDLIGAGLANDKMIEDMNTINAWLDKQAYSLDAAREQGLAKTNKSGKEYFSASEMREEYFARAFEAYLTEGKFPETSNNKLRSALHRLANALKTIYRNALALNAPIDDSIRAFFDGLFAVDQVVEDTSTLEAILRVVDAGAIAMPKDALKDLEKDVELAREDAETEANLAALRAYCQGLNDQKKTWRDEAKAAYIASKAEQAFAYVRRGHRISEDFLRNVLKLDEETIAILKGKRLTVKGTPAKVKSEAQAEAPVQEETATAEAPVEEKPPVEPAPEIPPVTLEGINDGNIKDVWKSIDKNAPVIIPDVDTLYYVLDMLIKKDDFHDERLSNAYTQLTKVGKQSGQEYYKADKNGNVRTKQNFDALVKFVMHNQTVEDFDRMKKTDSLDAEDQSGRTGYDTTADTRAATPLKDTTQEILDAFEKVVNEMPEGEDKKIARIIFEHTRSEYRIVKKDIYEEYKENGGTLGKSAVYGHIKRIQDEIRNRLSEQDYDLIDFYSFQTGTAEELPADILETMRETGYEDIMSMLDDLRTAVGERQFIKNFMLDKEAQYRDSFLQNPVWNSETGALRYMDALLRALKLTEGMKYNERKKLAIQKAKDEIEALKVRDIVSEERNACMSLKSNAEAIMKALKDKKHDKEAAIAAAVFMHANAVRLEAIRKVRERLDNTRSYVRRMSKLKPGSTVEGDAVTAIVDVLFHLKLTARRPAWSGEPGAPQSVTGVFREIVERSIGEMGLTPDMLGKDGYPNAGQIVEAEMGQWSEWLMNQISGGAGFVDDYRDLTFDQFEEVRDFVGWLRDRGHDTVATDKATFAAKRRETMDGILASLDENATGKYTRHQDKTATEKLRAMTRTGQHQLKTLVFMSHFLDGNTEFYGEHKIGAFRKLQLKVSEGVARQQFWYQKISSAVKPHVLALMKSAKERKLRFEVKNEITKDVYDDIHGETAAFVLLNAGQVDGRQRLMSGFGWTEEELDDNLRQFTEEDFKHAEAIWAELNTLGRELAKVFYQHRHYRMKWAKLAPINLILNDGKGTHIMSEGGYYPIAYSYREGEEVRNDDIMNPFRAPARLARPSATYGREARVENAALLLSPTVIERSIMENARYIGLWEPLRMMNSIWTDGAVKRSIIRNFSEEAYDTLRDLMNQVNDPDRGEKGKWKKIVSYLGSAMAVAALGFKATTMAKQYASLSIGAERLKALDPKTGQVRNFFMESFQKGMTNLKKLRDEVSNESPFLRDRYNLIDRDLKVVNSEFKSKFGKAVDWYRRWAFFGLKWNDLNVAVVQWDAAYNWALFTQKDMTPSEARAFADDFVASTQGGARDVDIPEVQLSTFGRLITPFFGPSAAAANTRIAGFSTMRDMTPAERIIFVVDNLLVPGLEQAVVMAVSAGAIGWAVSGGDDEDAWDRVQQKFLIAMLTEPLSGIPMIQDISDAAIRSAVTGKPVQSGVFDVSLFRPLEESARDMNQIIRNMKKMEDFGCSLYLGASIAGTLTRMPIIQVYEDYERMLINNNLWFSDERAEKQLKGERK